MKNDLACAVRFEPATEPFKDNSVDVPSKAVDNLQRKDSIEFGRSFGLIANGERVTAPRIPLLRVGGN
jgi:hypothetical protein